MKKTQSWVALAAVAALAVLAGGWFLLVSPKRAAAADLRIQAASQRSAVAGLRVQLATLQAQEKGLPAQKDKLAAVLAKMPSAAGVPDLIRALTAASATSGVELVSFTPGGLTALAAPAAPATPATPATPAGTAPGAASATADPAAAPTGRAAAATDGVQVLPLDIQVVGGYANVERYLNELESTSRALRVTGLSLAPGSSPVQHATPGSTVSPGTDGSTLKVAITAQAYVYTPPTGVGASPAAGTTAPSTATAVAPAQ